MDTISRHKISLAMTQYFPSSLGLMALVLISETTAPWNAVDSYIFCLAGIH